MLESNMLNRACLVAAISASTLLGASLFSTSSAGAASLMAAAPSATFDTSLVQEVRQGCGTGYRRGPNGGCIRQTAPAGPYGANKCWFHNGVKVCR